MAHFDRNPVYRPVLSSVVRSGCSQLQSKLRSHGFLREGPVEQELIYTFSLPLFTRVPGETVWKVFAERPRWGVFGRAKRQNRALSSRFVRLVGYRFGTYSDFPDSLWKVNSRNFALTEFSEVRIEPVLCR